MNECLLIVHAEVERVFSQVNLIKTSRRAMLKTDLLEAILYCKFGLSKFGSTPENFIPPVHVLRFDASIYVTERSLIGNRMLDFVEDNLVGVYSH